MKISYSIGLDLGTNSVGWAVVDRNYEVVKKGGKRLWGVVLFEDGKSSKEYRLNRSARRRFERRKERIKTLQMLMAKSMHEVDDGFFRRLQSSFLANERVDVKSGRNYRYNLFNGDYTDKDFYGKYKTIYHLRKKLIESDEKEDISLIYLALHHIIKYRGHFLTDGEIDTSGASIDIKLEELADKIGTEEKPVVLGKEYREELLNKTKTKNDKVKRLKELGKDSPYAEFVAKMLLGLKGDVKKTFAIDADIKSISFRDGFDEVFAEISSNLTAEQTDIILLLQEIYMQATLIDILGEGNSSISSAMVAKYNKHQADLKKLKLLLKENMPLYDSMFKSPRKDVLKSVKDKNLKDKLKVANYSNYVKTSTAQTRYFSGVKRDDFYKFVKETLKSISDNDIKTEILNDIEKEEFMPRINDVSNSSIPYQLNLAELKKILDKQEKYYPELKENREKIISVLTFRRPYSLGVLNTSNTRGTKSRFSWIDQTIDKKLYPWDFGTEEMLGFIDSANENFIRNMVGRDAFNDNPVLPLQSITYEKYVFLNEISNLKYKEKPLSSDLKKEILQFALTKQGGATVTGTDIEKIIKNKFGMQCEKDDLQGFAQNEGKRKLISSLKTYREFLKMSLSDAFTEEDISKYDKIVEVLTVFKDKSSKKRLLSKLFSEWGFDKSAINSLAEKSYNGWGKYSPETLLYTYTNETPQRNVLTLLLETEMNMQQILYDENLGIREQTVGKKNIVEKPTYKSIIEPLYANSAVKKTVWQAYKVVEEVVKIMGCDPEWVFVESTREEDEKKKKKSRYDKLKELYKEIRKETNYYNKSLEDELDKFKDTSALDSEKLYLYMLQLGRCMYTEQKLSIDKLSEYEVDHIVPRCFIKDDSIENKALVIKEANQRKTSLALSNEIITNREKFWNLLKSKNFISDKKFNNLIHNDWTEREVEKFINRQLVETSQINKLMGEVLKKVYPSLENNVVYVKAGISSLLRKYHTDQDPEKYGNFFKLRNLNDYHHAKDAYLCVVMGLFNLLYFDGGHNLKYNYIKRLIEESKADEKHTRELVNKRYGVMIDEFCDGVYTCVNEDGEEVSSTVAYNNFLSVMDRNDISVVKKVESWGETEFYKQTLFAKPKLSGMNKLQPKKLVEGKNGEKVELNPEIYGGYSAENQAYYIKISYEKNKKRVEELIGVPALIATRAKNGEQNIIKEWVDNNEKGYKKAEIIGKPIGKYQLIRYGGQLVYITSDNELSNAQQLIINKKYHKMLYLIEKCLKSEEKEKLFTEACKLDNFDIISKEFVLEYVARLEKYYPLFESIKDKVVEFLSNGFDSLEAKDKCRYIANLMIITARGSGRVDMPKNWNGGSSWGRITGKTIIPNMVDWIDQSITGYYVNTVSAKK